MLEIATPVDGMICNRHDGQTTAAGLQIQVAGAADGPVHINGRPARMQNGRFTGEAILDAPQNQITVRAGSQEQRLTALYDRHSRPRCRFSVDDNIWWLRDIAAHPSYRSIFDNWFLAFWRELNRRYGLRPHFNLFLRDEIDFTLAQMPDRFKSEWRDNANWMRLTFHSEAEFPDRPYEHAGYDGVARDFRQVTDHIIRFAGEELLSNFTTIHWCVASREGCRALRAHGVRGLAGYFIQEQGKPDISYYLDAPRQQHLFARDYWKDTELDLAFIKHDLIVNTVPLEQINPALDALAARPHESEILELMIHEQYFYPDYERYEPDARQRVEACARWIVEHNYKWAFYDEGFLGATAENRR